MLRQMSDGWEISCDECGIPKFLEAGSFFGAVKTAKVEEGWAIFRNEKDRKFVHLCPECGD